MRALTGEDPRFPQGERLYVTRAIRYVDRVTLADEPIEPDALPLFDALRPDIWVVGEQEDTPGKREFCAAHGLEYVVLKRAPKEGLPRRTSTNLRGF